MLDHAAGVVARELGWDEARRREEVAALKTRYGTLKRWAQLLKMNDAVKLLDATLKEESTTDETLTKLADSVVNEEALGKAA